MKAFHVSMFYSGMEHGVAHTDYPSGMYILVCAHSQEVGYYSITYFSAYWPDM